MKMKSQCCSGSSGFSFSWILNVAGCATSGWATFHASDSGGVPSSNGAVIRACSGIVRLEVEVAGDDRRGRAQVIVERSAARFDDLTRPGMPAALRVDRAQGLDLGGPFELSVILEVRSDDAHAAERRAHDGLERDPRHASLTWVDRIRQQVAKHLPDRQARQDQVAEVAPLPGVAGNVDDRAGHRGEIGQLLRDLGELIFAAAAGEPGIGEVARDFLQTQHVEIGQRPGMRHYTRRIDPPVDASAPLHVPGDDFHRPLIWLKGAPWLELATGGAKGMGVI